jgi:hypothetical protein
MTNALQDAEPGHTLFVLPRGEGQGFRASVRGHVLDLIDPGSYALAPTTDDLFVVAIAASLAWSARSLLRAEGLPDYVSVAAEWRMGEDPPSPADINLRVTVSKRAEGMGAALTAAFEQSLATRFMARPVVDLSFEGS